ncbi:hypothetical protein BKA80DRAFT_17743 [Phyllosticta citrichinensis]
MYFAGGELKLTFATDRQTDLCIALADDGLLLLLLCPLCFAGWLAGSRSLCLALPPPPSSVVGWLACLNCIHAACVRARIKYLAWGPVVGVHIQPWLCLVVSCRLVLESVCRPARLPCRACHSPIQIPTKSFAPSARASSEHCKSTTLRLVELRFWVWRLRCTRTGLQPCHLLVACQLAIQAVDTRRDERC